MMGSMGTSADGGVAPVAPGHRPYLPEPTGPGPVGTFFDQHLRSKPQALLDQPSPRYPEVMFCSPETKTST
jgi:hypothetical protein